MNFHLFNSVTNQLKTYVDSWASSPFLWLSALILGTGLFISYWSLQIISTYKKFPLQSKALIMKQSLTWFPAQTCLVLLILLGAGIMFWNLNINPSQSFGVSPWTSVMISLHQILKISRSSPSWCSFYLLLWILPSCPLKIIFLITRHSLKTFLSLKLLLSEVCSFSTPAKT